jgi:hypothetical protein
VRFLRRRCAAAAAGAARGSRASSATPGRATRRGARCAAAAPRCAQHTRPHLFTFSCVACPDGSKCALTLLRLAQVRPKDVFVNQEMDLASIEWVCARAGRAFAQRIARRRYPHAPPCGLRPPLSALPWHACLAHRWGSTTIIPSPATRRTCSATRFMIWRSSTWCARAPRLACARRCLLEVKRAHMPRLCTLHRAAHAPRTHAQLQAPPSRCRAQPGRLLTRGSAAVGA